MALREPYSRIADCGGLSFPRTQAVAALQAPSYVGAVNNRAKETPITGHID